MDIDPDWAVHAKLALASLGGGIVRLYVKPATSLLRTVGHLFSCMTCGYYGTPVVMYWWGIDQSLVGAVGAGMGFLGLSVAEAALRWADKLDLREWLRSLLTKKEA